MASDLINIMRDALRSDRDITGKAKKRGDLFSKSVELQLSAETRQGVRSIVEENRAQGYADAVRELELSLCLVSEGAYRRTFGNEPKPIKKAKR